MASPPPPYNNITGISRTVMKDNAQESLSGYNGNARPGEIVADLTTDPPALYVGNNAGALTAIAAGGGSTGNITFTNTTMSPPDGEDLFITAANSEVEITGLDFRVEVTDDVRIQGNDLVSIRNTSSVEAITIRTDYNGNDYAWEFDATGNLITPGSIEVSGDITMAGYITGTSGASTLVLAAEPDSNTAIQLNDSVDSIIRTVANLEIRTDSSNTDKTWTFDTTGDFTAPGNITATNLPTKFSASWTVPTGNSTQSFTVVDNNTYQMWVSGNIPNGIIVWNATVTVTNTNVPVLGQQFAWNYEGGGSPLLLTSIPDQIVGTAGTISNAAPAVANTNVFSFGINNASGSTVTVDYGWIRIS